MNYINDDLLEFLQCIIGCDYISDLRTEPYNVKAMELLKCLNLNYFSLDQIKDTINYIYERGDHYGNN